MGDGVGEPTEAFDLLSNEVRLRIIRALGEATAAEETPCSFTDLQRRAGVEDNGRFNYHLTKLLGRLVNKSGEGYELRPAGSSLYRAIISGAYADEDATEPVAVDDEECPYCGADAAAWYDDGKFHMGCTACDNLVVKYPIPAGSFDPADPRTLVAAGDACILRDQASMRQGLCPYCSGPVESRLTEEDGGLAEFNERVYSAVVESACGRCSWAMYCGVPFALNVEPAVISFFHDHGIDVLDSHPWSIYRYASETVRSREPWEVEVRCSVGGEELRLTVDGDAEVVGSERSRPEPAD